jgi:hypothetical protein
MMVDERTMRRGEKHRGLERKGQPLQRRRGRLYGGFNVSFDLRLLMSLQARSPENLLKMAAGVVDEAAGPEFRQKEM